jgi:DNA-binding response OmpR family regulator
MATILVVDEDELLRERSRRILEADGHRVHAVPNGMQALLVCGEHPDGIDLLLVERRLPDMLGSELYLLARPSQARLAVLFTATGHEATDAPVIQRPFRSEALRDRVRQELCRTAT